MSSRSKSAVDKRQNVDIHELFRRLKLRKSRSGASSTRSRGALSRAQPAPRPPRSRPPTGGKPRAAPPAAPRRATKATADNPLVQSVAGQINPSNPILKGKLSCLADARPSQKFITKGRTTISVPAGNECFMFFEPSIVSDIAFPSMVSWTMTTANTATTFVTDADATSTPTGVAEVNLIPSSPLTAAIVTAQGGRCRNVSNHVSIQYDGIETNRGGTLTFIDNVKNDILPPNEWATTALNNLGGQIQAHACALRNSFQRRPVWEFVIAGGDHRPNGPGQTESGAAWNIEVQPNHPGMPASRVGGVASTKTMCSISAFAHFINPSGASVNLEVNLSQHWEYISESTELLHTPSVSHIQCRDACVSILNHARAAHSATPSISFKSACQFAMKTAHSKAAMTGVEDVMMAAMALA